MPSIQRNGASVAEGVAIILLMALIIAFSPDERDGAATRRPLAVTGSIIGVLSGADGAFAQARQVRPFVFPGDHGPHPAYRNEWWYFSGNLQSGDGAPFGFQLTFFRFGLRPLAVHRDSAWGTDQIYMGHFALTDVAAGRFYSAERFSRSALGLSGAQAVPFRVWLRDWQAKASGKALFPLHLRAAHGEVALDLQAVAAKALVLQGDRGLSRKHSQPGNASYYYSYPRLNLEGVVRVAGHRHRVRGSGWLDREWGSAVLGPDQAGWDWFGLQFDDHTELMYYRLRRHDGTAHPYGAGVFVDRQGNTTHLDPGQVRLEPLSFWQSPRSGARYPVSWRLTVPSLGRELTITALLNQQEHRHAFRYWEGAVAVSGRHGPKALTGRGYAELVGY